MNNNILYVFTVCLIGLLSHNSTAQIRFHNAEVGISYWERAYDGVSENTLINGNPGNKGGWMPHLGAELGISTNFGVDARVGLWSGRFETGGDVGSGIIITETIEQRIVPVSLGLIYRSNAFMEDAMNFYAGAGVNHYFIRNRSYSSTTDIIEGTTAEMNSSNNYGTYLKAGLEYFTRPNWGLALEGRYNTGSYDQQYQSSSNGSTEELEIALRGFQVGLSLKYRFGTE